MPYIMKTNSCNICESDKKVFLGYRGGMTSKRRVSDSESPQTGIFRCQICGLIYPDPIPIPSDDRLQDQYKATDNYFEYRIDEKRLKFYEGILDELKLLVKKDCPTLLDIGSGRGELLHVAGKLGFRGVGTDISREFAEYARKRFSVDVRVGELGSLGFKESSFDCVTLSALLEHVYDPKEFLSQIYRVLKPGGILYIEVPNEESLALRIGDAYYKYLLRRRWTTRLSPTFPPYHIYGFSKKSIKRVLALKGFNILRFRISGSDYAMFPHAKTMLDKVEKLSFETVNFIAGLLGQGINIRIFAAKG